MLSILQDVRFAVRQLRRAQGFTLTAVLTLAMGLGASSAIFCLIDGRWLHPMRVPNAGQLVRVFSTTQQNAEGYFSYSEYQALAQRTAALKSAVAIGRRGSIMPRADGTAQLLLTNVVSNNFFDALGVRPALGRAFNSNDAARLRVRPGVLLGYGFWRREFNGDPTVVGRQITLLRGQSSRVQMDVWGVLPADFRETENGADRDLWMPAESWAALNGSGELTSRTFRWFNVIGRLESSASVNQVNQQVAVIAGSWTVADPANNRGRGARAVSDLRYRMDTAGTSGLVLFAIVCGVVLLAIVNVAHLLLARALAREPEIALRLSLGATPWVVARQLLVENLLLGLAGLAAGLGLAAAIAALLPRLLVLEPVMLASYGSGAGFHVDTRVFLFASSMALATMLLLALVPLSQTRRPQLLPVLQASAVTRTTGRTSIARRAAIWLQIGISFALLVSTGTLVRSFLNTRSKPIGLTRNQVLVAFTQEPEAPVRDTVVANLRALPGVENVAYGIRSPLMLSEGGIAAKVVLPSRPDLRDPVEIKYNAVSPAFLSVTGTRILRGRGFDAADDADGPPVAIVSQAMARRYWPAQEPIGQIVRLPGFKQGAVNSGTGLEARVIGVAEDAPIEQIGEIPEPYMYLPFHLTSMGEMTFVVQTRQNAMSLAQDVRQVLIHANPLLDPMFVSSLPELIRFSAGNYQMMAELVTALGLAGLALTVVGLYGFLAFRVTQRRREIGIRMALGATRQGTAWLVVRDTARMAAIGLAIGVVLALGAARLESSVLFGVRPMDAPSLVAAFGILTLALAAAVCLPARRAASVEPMQALRNE